MNLIPGQTVYQKLLQSLVAALLLMPLLVHAAGNNLPSPPNIAASGYYVMDIHSGQVLASKNPSQRLEPASLTKIMTAYIVFQELAAGNIKPQDEVLVSKKAWKMPGSRMFIEVDKRVSIDALMKGMIIQSGNDASVALAEHIAGSEESFALMMNEQAARLGMVNTHFTNATGLPDGDHYTTPEDILKVAAASIKEFPEYYKLYSVKEYTFNNIRQHNRNNLLWRDKSVDGMKTGHTEAAGYCLVASAERDNMRLITVVMGTESSEARVRETKKLLEYGYRYFETHRLYGAGQKLLSSAIWKGKQDQIELGLANDLYVTVQRGQYSKLAASTELPPRLIAPISKNESLGKAVIKFNDEIIAERPLLALHDVPEGSFIKRITDSVMMMLE